MTVAEILKEHDCVEVEMPWPMAMAAAVVTGVSMVVAEQAGSRLLALAKKGTARALRFVAAALEPEAPAAETSSGYVYAVPEPESHG